MKMSAHTYGQLMDLHHKIEQQSLKMRDLAVQLATEDAKGEGTDYIKMEDECKAVGRELSNVSAELQIIMI